LIIHKKLFITLIMILSVILSACNQITKVANPLPDEVIPREVRPTLPPPRLFVEDNLSDKETQPASSLPITALSIRETTLEDDQGAIIVAITPVTMDRLGDTLYFEVSMDTHTIDLSMDLSQFASLITDGGKTVQPLEWEAPRGGHHVSGTLSFPASVDGTPLLIKAKTLTLILRDVDVPLRTFTWPITGN